MDKRKPVTPTDFEATPGLEDWRVVSDGACAFFATSSFEESVDLVRAISEIAGVEDHPPAVDIRNGGVTIRLITATAEYMGMTEQDAELARLISAAARDLGLPSDPSRLQSILVIPGAPSRHEVMPFWQALLGYELRLDSPDEDLVDAQDRGPGFWFESMKEPRADGGGAIHVAVWVPHDQAEARVEAALAAGGRMVRDEFAPSWWTLADAAGNEADISTVRGRDRELPDA
jgi:4a-hydroxytetrahydrobiopterin dehydratase